VRLYSKKVIVRFTLHHSLEVPLVPILLYDIRSLQHLCTSHFLFRNVFLGIQGSRLYQPSFPHSFDLLLVYRSFLHLLGQLGVYNFLKSEPGRQADALAAFREEGQVDKLVCELPEVKFRLE
jgi:hypothetical protein